MTLNRARSHYIILSSTLFASIPLPFLIARKIQYFSLRVLIYLYWSSLLLILPCPTLYIAGSFFSRHHDLCHLLPSQTFFMRQHLTTLPITQD